MLLKFTLNLIWNSFYRGFSVVDLVQDQKTHRGYALKRIICHSKEDERTAMKEAEYHNMFNSPYILECIDVALVESYDGLHPHRSEVLLLLPYYRVLLMLLLLFYLSFIYNNAITQKWSILRIFHGWQVFKYFFMNFITMYLNFKISPADDIFSCTWMLNFT